MAFPQVIAALFPLFLAIGLPGTIVLERRFHVLWYILRASLAVSDLMYI